eukprot:3598523-Pleurochrysis_carterae.AAC.1
MVTLSRLSRHMSKSLHLEDTLSRASSWSLASWSQADTQQETPRVSYSAVKWETAMCKETVLRGRTWEWLINGVVIKVLEDIEIDEVETVTASVLHA